MSDPQITELARLYKRIKPDWKELGKYIRDAKEWNEWLDKHPEDKEKEISYATIGGIQTFLNMVHNEGFEYASEITEIVKKKDGGTEKRFLKKTTLDRKIEKAQIIEEVLKRAIKEFKSPSQLKLDNRKSQKNESQYYSWFLYFLHITSPTDPDKTPKVGRVILKIAKKNSNATPKAILENLKEGDSEDYQCDEIEAIDNKIFAFNFRNTSNTRKLYIKAPYPNSNIKHEIVVGVYASYDTDKIFGGRLVLEKIKDNHPDGDLKPLLISPYDNKENYAKVDKSILELLSLKDKNYLHIPRNTKGTLDGFIQKISTESPFKHTERRFLDFQTPRLFLSIPNNTLKYVDSYKSTDSKSVTREKDIIRLTDGLKVGLKSIVDLERHEWPIWDKKENKVSGIDESVFKELQRTKFFVLILEDTDKSSISLIQLGWALAYCKNIFVIHRKSNDNDHSNEIFKELCSLGITTQDYTRDLTQSFGDMIPVITQWIISFVKNST